MSNIKEICDKFIYGLKTLRSRLFEMERKLTDAFEDFNVETDMHDFGLTLQEYSENLGVEWEPSSKYSKATFAIPLEEAPTSASASDS